MAAAERRSGSYSVRVSLTDPLTGKRTQKRVTARTKRELDAKVAALKTAWHAGTYVEPNGQRLGDYLGDWLGTLNHSGATRHVYTHVVRRHLLSDTIAAIPLGRLHRAHVQGLIDRKVAAGYAPSTSGASTRSCGRRSRGRSSWGPCRRTPRPASICRA
jgi:hypothetical protein